MCRVQTTHWNALRTCALKGIPVLKLSDFDYQHDVFIMAADLTDSERLLTETLTTLTDEFQWVVFVPGNHEAWVQLI